MRVWDPALTGQERPAFEMTSHKSRLVEMNGILSMARLTFNSPPVTCSPTVTHVTCYTSNYIYILNILSSYSIAFDTGYA